MASREPLEVFAKAAPGSGSPSRVRGACPFSQKVCMALEERDLPYRCTYIEEGPNKPDWFTQHNPSGLLPVLKDGDTWIQDSDKILEYLNQKFPAESEDFKIPEDLAPKVKQMSEALFDTLTEWLESKNKFSGAATEYRNVVRQLNSHLEGQRLYLAGSHATDADFDLFPKLSHARMVLLYFMDFEIPLDFAAVHRYIELMENRESFRRTCSPEMEVLQEWKEKFDLPEPQLST